MKTIKYFCTLLLTALTFTACSNEEIVEPEQNQQPATEGEIPFTAVFGVKNGSSRALTDPDDGTLNVSWAVDEEIAIVFGGSKYTVKVTEVDDDGNATVSGTLPSSISHNQAVTFIYPASAADESGLRSDLLANQDGTLSTISSSLDVATAEGSIIIVSGKAQPNGTVTLENQFAICKFQFKDESDQTINDIESVKITDLSTNEVITVAPTSPQASVYVAMKPSNNTTKFLVTRSNGDPCEKTSNAHMQAGKFYCPTFSMTFAANACPLTFEAMASGTISFKNNASGPVYYSINGGERAEIAAGQTGTPTLAAGQKVCFYGDNSRYYSVSNAFTFPENCYIYGNIMSLISSTDFADLTELPNTDGRNFSCMFRNCYQLKNHQYKKLVLPATKLQQLCYYQMFYGCNGLTEAPELPATTLCYGCYDEMFVYCYGLTKAPDLPATTLAKYCYEYMFMGCKNLNSVKCLATDRSATGCTDDWLYGVSSTGTFTKAAGATWDTGASGIPNNWTVVEE